VISLSRAEYVLAAGLASAIAATALVQLVLLGLLGLLLAPVALALMLVACYQLRDASVSWRRAVAGWGLFLTGVVILTYAAGRASSYGYSIMWHRTHPSEVLPSTSGWAELVLWCIASALAVSAGLGLRTRWPLARLIAWGAAILAVSPLGMALFFLMALAWPIGT